MKKIVYVLMLCLAQVAMAQTDTDYENVLSKIATEYNAKSADNLFALFSDDLKTTFTLDQVKAFITENHEKKGEMGDASFLLDGEGDKSYLVEFTNSTSIIIMAILSPDNKLTKFVLEEY